MRNMRSLYLVSLLGTLLAKEAIAETPSLDARTFRPSIDPRAGLANEPTQTMGAGNVAFSSWFAYVLDPVALRHDGTGDVLARPVRHVVSADLLAAVGIGSRAQVGVSVPVILYQESGAGVPTQAITTTAVANQALGDLGLHGKISLKDNETGGLGIAALSHVTLPTGDRTSFVGEGAATVGVRALVDYSLVVLGAQASAGYTLRTTHRTWPDPGGVTFGDSIPWHAGLWFRPKTVGLDEGDRLRWELGVRGSLPAGPALPFGAGDPGSAAQSPVLLNASNRIALGRRKDAFLLGGIDVGLTDALGTPPVRLVFALGWAPREHDMDHDGVKDDEDACPEIAEDRDGFEDTDGCPEIDNDDDGVVDKEDACKDLPGVETTDPKTNGCPEKDADGDGVPDAEDRCPTEKGSATASKKGCPPDQDDDGIADARDRCPTQPEDFDGFQDEDGCPDLDDDGDGVADAADACPRVAGEASNDAKYNGCPSPDRDGDTFDNEVDRCPDEAETWNGVQDDDGCADDKGTPLVVFDMKRPRPSVKLKSPIRFAGTDIAPTVHPDSLPTLRALVTELNRHRDWELAVGARPARADATASQQALARSAVVVRELARLARRDAVAETVSWDAVKTQPYAEAGLGLLVLIHPAVEKPAPK